MTRNRKTSRGFPQPAILEMAARQLEKLKSLDQTHGPPQSRSARLDAPATSSAQGATANARFMASAEDRADRRLILFIKLGRFSNTNAYVEAQLRKNFPEAELAIVDLRAFYRRPSLALFQALASAMMSACLRSLRGRSSHASLKLAFFHQLLRTPAAFDGMSRYAIRCIERQTQDVWFTFQTQSMWNNTTEGIPNFVYTDSANLTILYYREIDFLELPPPTWLERERNLFRAARKIFIMSNHVGRSLSELYGIDGTKIARVNVGANLREIPSTVCPAPVENKTILFVGLNWELKGGPELLQAFQKLPSRHSDATLVLVGAAPQIDVPRCVNVGRVPPEKMPDYYQQAAIFCMPTYRDAFGIVFIEAIMHGVTVAAPRHGAMTDYIADKRTGVLFEPGDVDDIARALTWLLDNPQERQAMAERAFTAVSTTYNWDAVGARLRAEIDP